MVRAAQEAVLQRPNFAIDAIGDSDDEDDEGQEVEDDSGVMDEASPDPLILKLPLNMSFWRPGVYVNRGGTDHYV